MCFITTELMIMASHQTFYQIWHLTGQIKFDQTNLLYIINGEVSKYTIGKQISGHFSTLIISTALRPCPSVANIDSKCYIKKLKSSGTCLIGYSDFISREWFFNSLGADTNTNTRTNFPDKIGSQGSLV